MTNSSLFQSRYRYVVVPSRMWQYAVLDRATNRTVVDEISRAEARQIVKEKNRPKGAM